MPAMERCPSARRRQPVPAVLLAAFISCLMASPVTATDLFDLPDLPDLPLVGPEPQRQWALTAFIGQNDDDRFVEILMLEGGDWESSYIAGLALSRHFATTFRHMHWEAETSVYRHWGLQRHWEANIALVARWTHFPWDRYLDTSVAFGQGISWAGDPPAVEGETRRILNHLLAEVEATPFRDTPLSLVLRVHHRSGVFGLYGVRGGSNFVNIGVRYRF
jgi:hypothetical protein